MYPRYENSHKRYVEVNAIHRIGGRIDPVSFTDEDGVTAEIDRIIDVRQAASLKAGGNGTRYTCEVEGNQIMLYHDRNDWFIEI